MKGTDMIQIRKSKDRGHFDHGWLNTYHTFSFGDYHDPNHMNFRNLRVINEDWVETGKGFSTHPHQDMEIITYVLEGTLEHKDSMGNSSVIRPGEVQRMSAGTGVTHSEFNPSQTEPVHLLQIWILPNQKKLKPGYEQKKYSDEEKQGKLRLVASESGENGSVKIHQDVKVYATLLSPGQKASFQLDSSRHGWVQVARGLIDLNGQKLEAGDGAALTKESALKIKAKEKSEILLFDLG